MYQSHSAIQNGLGAAKFDPHVLPEQLATSHARNAREQVSWGMRKSYPSDISKEAFEEIRPVLESVRKQTRPRTVDLYEVLCGVLYLLKSGCQWRMLPSEYPKWRTVHAYFAKWSEPGPDGFSVLERALKMWLARLVQDRGASSRRAF